MSTPNRIPKNQIRILIAILLTGFLSQRAIAQFAPAAGQPGSTALRADSSCFINWASKCHVQRGLKQINLPDSGYASVGSAQSAIGQASTNGVASLGDGGIATLTFDPPISDGNGFDFAIFENTFLDSFLGPTHCGHRRQWLCWPAHHRAASERITAISGYCSRRAAARGQAR